ncbi:hypothetical protein SXCC_04421 [Gluconacetobacter sp. SXCC-1]|nr:hypothetical protein SXCC_04421 [Gluconacetobacter sp. SXCC-1]
MTGPGLAISPIVRTGDGLFCAEISFIIQFSTAGAGYGVFISHSGTNA